MEEKQKILSVMNSFAKIYKNTYEALGRFWLLLVITILATGGYLVSLVGKLDEANIFIYVIGGCYICSFVIYTLSHILKGTKRTLAPSGFLISAMVGIYASYRLVSAAMLKSLLPRWSMFIVFASLVMATFALSAGIFRLLRGIVFEDTIDTKRLKLGLIASAIVAFIVYIYIPAESFFGNFTDYAFPYQIMVVAYLSNVVFFSLVVALLLAVVKVRFFHVLYGLLFGFLLAVYGQYMFFNRTIGSVDGTKYNWHAHAASSIINMVVWIMLMGLGCFLGARYTVKTTKAFKYGFVFVGLIHLLTYVTLILQADKMCFNFSAVYYSYENQFKVASQDNIIVFIVDALDNDYAKELYASEDSVLDYYHDFSMYTNTCSVYDYTSASMLQMMTNFEFDNTQTNLERREMAWNSPWVNEFYGRLHEAGYRVEVYNFDNEDTEYVIGKVDNAVELESANNKPQYISYKGIRQNIGKLTRFTLFPNMLKGMVSIDNISFKDAIYFRGQDVIYNNDEFYDNLNLELADYDKAVIVHHTIGCHAPYDNVDTARYCLMYVGEYIKQMQALGVYDDATIMVTADHGAHDDDPLVGRFASTPLLLIKRAGESHEEMLLNGAPVYHQDFMPSILKAANQYEAGDEELFGRSFFDYSQGDIRERTWYDRVLDSNYTMQIKYNTYYGYTYTGDEDDLKESVLNDTNLNIYPVSRNND